MEGENKSDYNVGVSSDIEQNITNSIPNTPNHDHHVSSTNDHDDDMEKVEASEIIPSPPPPSPSLITRLVSMLKNTIAVIVFIAISPLHVLFFMICFVLLGTRFTAIPAIGRDGVQDSLTNNNNDDSASQFYTKLYESVPTLIKVRALSMTITCRLGCLLLLWLVVSLPLHALKTATFLGLIHWKWSLLATLLTLSYPYIFLTIVLFAYMSIEHLLITRAHNTYYFAWGLLDSVASLIHVVFVFLVWMLYFHGHEGLDKGVDKYATRTLAALLVGVFLWLLKTALLLLWEQKAIYAKFRARILMSGFRLFFLILILDDKLFALLLPCRYQKVDNKWEVQDYVVSSSKRNIQDYVVSSTHVSLQQMKTIAEFLTNLTKMSSSRGDDQQLSDIMDAYERKIAYLFRDPKHVTPEIVISYFVRNVDTAQLLAEELQSEYPSKHLNQVPFDKWVVDSHKSCVSVAYTLVDAFAMVNVLDTILTCCLIIAVILLWLLITELATTKVLVVIASPFLALTFVFGDMCKTFFQGFIFAFITHPFDVGDRCVIDGVEVEVKRVNIMTTTCLRIGTNEQMLYPNSNLATTLIINLGDKLDPTDVIELILHPSTKMSEILDLQNHIENFVDSDEQSEFFEKERRVVVKEMKNGIDMIVYFQHTMDGKDVSHSQFLEKKERQRSQLFIQIKKFLDNLGVQVATS